ncbi:unnamed protein product [Caenorhabditis angaria]|uniref:Uncharacterized protein n=1 Tax=Caenorhabditis angaria TaxID=860376 RepID=A0A9P1NCW7_9PELO|nr:unnamed protein product [Caenorhabditis angaria]
MYVDCELSTLDGDVVAQKLMLIEMHGSNFLISPSQSHYVQSSGVKESGKLLEPNFLSRFSLEQIPLYLVILLIVDLAKIMSSKREATQDAPIEGGESSSSSSTTAKKPKAEGSEPTSTDTSTTTELAVSIPSVIPEAPGQIQESPNVQENVVVQPINEPNQECPTHPIGSSSTTNASNETNSAIGQRLLTQTDFDEVGDSSSSSTEDSPTHPIGSSSSTNSASNGATSAVVGEFVTPKELENERDWNARYDQTLLQLGIGRIRPDGKTVVPISIPFTQAVADLYGIDKESLQPEFGEGTLKMCTKLFDGKKSKASAKPSAGPSSSATPSTSSATAPQNQEEKEEEKKVE